MKHSDAFSMKRGNCSVKREWTVFCVHPPLMENIEFFPVNTEHPSRNSMHP